MDRRMHHRLPGRSRKEARERGEPVRKKEKKKKALSEEESADRLLNCSMFRFEGPAKELHQHLENFTDAKARNAREKKKKALRSNVEIH